MNSTQRRGGAETPESPELREHSIQALEPDLLLVFKPRGHAENEHRHPHGQTLRVLRGRLVVRIGGMDHVLTPSSAPLDIEPGTDHATVAETPTWLVAESFAPTTKDS